MSENGVILTNDDTGKVETLKGLLWPDQFRLLQHYFETTNDPELEELREENENLRVKYNDTASALARHQKIAERVSVEGERDAKEIFRLTEENKKLSREITRLERLNRRVVVSEFEVGDRVRVKQGVYKGYAPEHHRLVGEVSADPLGKPDYPYVKYDQGGGAFHPAEYLEPI